MGKSDKPDLMLRVAVRLAKQGVSVHWLKPKQKSPVNGKWSTAPVATPADLKRTYQPGYNLGIRPGKWSKIGDHFLQLIDLDIREADLAEEAWNCLLAFLPEARDLPMVVSGSGGESRHLWLLTDRPFKSKKLGRSKSQSLGADGKMHDDWSVTLYGTGLQAAIPPSIHPLTGQPYRWLKRFPWDLLDMGLGPIVDSDRVKDWAAEDGGENEDPDDLATLVRKRRLGLSDDEVDQILADLPQDAWCEDRDGWLDVGMALHHEYAGSQAGFEKWCAFSQRSEKYNEKDQKRVWGSFDERAKTRPVRMATLLKAAKEARLDRGYDWSAMDADTEVDPIEDLIGPASDEPEDDKSWRTQLDLTEEGDIRNSVSNDAIIMQYDRRLKGCVEFNEFTQEVVTRKPVKSKIPAMVHIPVVDKVNGDLWGEIHERNVRILLESSRGKKKSGYGLRVSDRDLRAAIDVAAHKRPFHPVRDYLAGLEWDGIERVESLFVDYLGAADTPYAREIAKLMCLGAVARVHEPGHKFDFVVILEGLQGKRKSTFIETLAKRWFAELNGDIHDRKQMVENMQGAWILELPELSGFNRSEVQAIKAFVSATSDKVRLAYAHRAIEYKRQNIIIGSTNDSEYLRDTTGGRRFWPIFCKVDEIDTNRLAREVDQIWAEATAMYRKMREKQPHGTLPLFLRNRSAQKEAAAMQESRRVESPEDAIRGIIEKRLDEPVSISGDVVIEEMFENLDGDDAKALRNRVCLMEIWIDILRRDPDHWNQMNSQLVGRAMRNLKGWEFVGQRRHPRYGPQRTFQRSGTTEAFTKLD